MRLGLFQVLRGADHGENGPSQTHKRNVSYRLKGSQSQYRVRALKLCISVDPEILPGICLKEMIMNMNRFSYENGNSDFTHKNTVSEMTQTVAPRVSHVMGYSDLFKRVGKICFQK